jgi:hypothetical protein
MLKIQCAVAADDQLTVQRDGRSPEVNVTVREVDHADTVKEATVVLTSITAHHLVKALCDFFGYTSEDDIEKPRMPKVTGKI